jgi:hypothetical protein
MLNTWPTNDALNCRVRPFGVSLRDLDMEFNEAATVSVTQLLQSCLLKDIDNTYSTDDILQWTLARRLQGLINIVIATQGDELTLDVHCQHKDCREDIELQVQLSNFYQSGFDDVVQHQVDASTLLTLRLPSGYDQLHWLQQDDVDNWDVYMATSLIETVNNKKPDDDFMIEPQWLNEIENVLEQHDSLMTLELETTCPQCNRTLSIPLDLEPQLLSVLHFEQKKLFNNIHVLAETYHWNEKDIMALSPRRRQYYIDLLNKDDDWL